MSWFGASWRQTSAARAYGRLALAVVAAIVFAAIFLGRPRPMPLPLLTQLDGPAPAQAKGVIFLLHGLGGNLKRVEWVVKALRAAGLPADIAIVTVEGPFAFRFGQSWGSTAEEQAASRARLRARMQELLGSSGPPPARVIIAGFSQGAGVAIDTAVEETRIGALASISPCLSLLRGELPQRRDLRVLLAHGSHDDTCPVNESRSLAAVLAAAHEPAQYIEFDGGHVIPPEIIRALAAFATAT